MEKYSRAGQATDDNMTHALCVLDNRVYTRARARTQALGIRNTYLFSTSIMAARTHLNVTLYVHCLSCIKMPKVAFRSSGTSKSLLYQNTFLHKASSFRSLTHAAKATVWPSQFSYVSSRLQSSDK